MISEKTKQDIADYLVGSCNHELGAFDAFPELEDDTDLLLSIVVEMGIDWCEQCGWCFEICELDNEPDAMICDDCHKENNPDEDE